MSRIRVLVVDGHPLFRQGVRLALEAHREIEVVGEARDGQAALRQADALRPDVVLCDLTLAGADVPAVIRALAARHPGAAVVLLTPHEGEAARRAALGSGAAAYAGKDIPAQALAALVARVAREECARPAGEATGATTPTSPLSPRETEILGRIARGVSNRDVARELGISDQTVKNHLSSVFRKLGVDGRTGAVLVAMRRGWIGVETIAQAHDSALHRMASEGSVTP